MRIDRTRRRRSFSGREFVTTGLRRVFWQDLYHLLMTVSWPRLLLACGGYFFLFNLLFAGIYSLQPGAIANLDPRGYWGRFFFSVETLATIGYGDMHPQTLFGHVCASCEAFIGLASLALITGMMFARFSRPSARFLFARYAVIHPVDGHTTLMIRAANARQNIVMEATAQLRLLRDETTVEGYRIRRIYDLPLRRSQHPMFLFGWNMMHVIDAQSPLADESAASLEQARAMLLLTMSGTDETTGQRLMTRQPYPASALRWNYAFVDILSSDEAGVDHFDYTRFHDIRPWQSAD